MTALVRHVIAALLIGAATTAAAAAQPNKQAQPAQSAPNALQGFSQNRDQPVKIESARLEVRDKEKKATFSGDVHLTQGDVTLTCRTLIVYYEQNAAPTAANPGAARVASTQPTAAQSGAGGTQSQIRRLEAIGDVVVVQKEQTATGSSGTFDMKTNTITLEGNVVVTQGMNVVRGERMVVDMTTGVSRVEPSKSGHGRVEGLFLPGSAKDPTLGPLTGPPKDGGKPPSGPMKLN